MYSGRRAASQWIQDNRLLLSVDPDPCLCLRLDSQVWKYSLPWVISFPGGNSATSWSIVARDLELTHPLFSLPPLTQVVCIRPFLSSGQTPVEQCRTTYHSLRCWRFEWNIVSFQGRTCSYVCMWCWPRHATHPVWMEFEVELECPL